MSTKKVYLKEGYSQNAAGKSPEISISWTRTAKSAAEHRREKEEVEVCIAFDWRRRLSKFYTHEQASRYVDDWGGFEDILQFDESIQMKVYDALKDFVDDVNEVYNEKQERIEANKSKRKERKVADKKLTKSRKG